jgi:NADPH2:quinone reductase
MMQAAVCDSFGKPPTQPKLKSVPVPEAGNDDVLIEVRAAGISFPETLIVQNKYQFKPGLPFIPGSEVSGVLRSVGADVTGWKVGDRVMCAVPVGGFAQVVVSSASNLVALPVHMSFEAGAGFMLNYGTTYYALVQRGALQAGETLLVLGAAGGVGSTAIQLGLALGATVIAACSSKEKGDFCRRLGAHHVVEYGSGEEAAKVLKAEVKALTGGSGCDVCYDPAGGPLAEAAVRSMAWGGRYLVIGFTAGIPRVPLNLLLLKSCSLVGVFWGAFIAQHSTAYGLIVALPRCQRGVYAMLCYAVLCYAMLCYAMLCYARRLQDALPRGGGGQPARAARSLRGGQA